MFYRLFVLGAVLSSIAAASDWPQNLGPRRDGLLPARELRTGWEGKDAPLAWRANAGLGSAPPIVVDGKVYVFGAFKSEALAEQLDDAGSVPTMAELKTLGIGSAQDVVDRVGEGALNYAILWSQPDKPNPNRQRNLEEKHWYFSTLYAQCFEAATGKRLWVTKLSDATPVSDAQPMWPQASPLYVDGKVFFHGPTGDLFLVDAATGSLIWERSLMKEGLIGWHGKQSNASGGFHWKDTIIVTFSHPPVYKGAMMAVNIADGSTAWKRVFDLAPFRSHFTRFSFAEIEGVPTLMQSLGEGTVGVNPDDGSVRWLSKVPLESQELYKKRFDELSSRWEGDEVQTKRMHNLLRHLPKSLIAPYPAYAPVAWENYVVDAHMTGHDDFTSQMWCIKIEAGQPKLVWQTLDTVPECHSDKSNMLAREGRLYVFDQNAYVGRAEMRGNRLWVPEARPFRGEDVGQFQCFDIATGQRLWHTNAFRTTASKGRDDTDHYKMIFVGDILIVTGNDGLWLARVDDKGVELLASASLGVDAYTGWNANVNSEPVLAGQQLFVRYSSPQADYGMNKLFGGSGNLYCFDLQPR